MPRTRNPGLQAQYAWAQSLGCNVLPPTTDLKRASKGFEIGRGVTGPVRANWPGAPSEARVEVAKLPDGTICQRFLYPDSPQLIAAEVPLVSSVGESLVVEGASVRFYANGTPREEIPKPIARGPNAEFSTLLINMLVQKPEEEFCVDFSVNSDNKIFLFQNVDIRIPKAAGRGEVQVHIYQQGENTYGEILVEDKELGGSFPIRGFKIKEEGKFLSPKKIKNSVFIPGLEESDIYPNTRSLQMLHMLYYALTGKHKPHKGLVVEVPNSCEEFGTNIALYATHRRKKQKKEELGFLRFPLPVAAAKEGVKRIILEVERTENRGAQIRGYAEQDGEKSCSLNGIRVVQDNKLLHRSDTIVLPYGVDNVSDIPVVYSYEKMLLVSALVAGVGDAPKIQVNKSNSKIIIFSRGKKNQDSLTIPKCLLDNPELELSLEYHRASKSSSGLVLIARQKGRVLPLYYYELVKDRGFQKGAIIPTRAGFEGFSRKPGPIRQKTDFDQMALASALAGDVPFRVSYKVSGKRRIQFMRLYQADGTWKDIEYRLPRACNEEVIVQKVEFAPGTTGVVVRGVKSKIIWYNRVHVSGGDFLWTPVSPPFPAWTLERVKKIEKTGSYQFSSLAEMLGFLSFNFKTRCDLSTFWWETFNKNRHLIAEANPNSRYTWNILFDLFRKHGSDPSVFNFLGIANILPELIKLFERRSIAISKAEREIFRNGAAKIVSFSKNKNEARATIEGPFGKIGQIEYEQILSELVMNERVRQRYARAIGKKVQNMSWRYRNSGLSIDDIVAAGNRGVAIALNSFNPMRGVQFFTFAHRPIVWEIVREIRDTGRTIRLPNWFHNLKYEVLQEFRVCPEEEVLYKYFIEKGETAETAKDYAELLFYYWPLENLSSTDQPLIMKGSGDRKSNNLLGGTIPGRRQLQDERMVSVERYQALEGLLDRLEPKEARAFALRWGLDKGHDFSVNPASRLAEGEEFLTFAQIGKILGCTGARAQQLVAGAEKELRQIWKRLAA